MDDNKHWKKALQEHPHLCVGITDTCDDCGLSRGDAVHTGPANHHRFSKFGFTLVCEDLPVDKGVSREVGLYRKEQCLARLMWAPKAKILYTHPGVSLVIDRDRARNPQIGLYRADSYGGPRGTISGTLLSLTFNAYWESQDTFWRNAYLWMRVKHLCKGWLQFGPFAVNWE